MHHFAAVYLSLLLMTPIAQPFLFRYSRSVLNQLCISARKSRFHATVISSDQEFTEDQLSTPPIPSIFQSSFLKTLSERGFIHQCTDFEGLDKILTSEVNSSAYLGFDATAKSLHVGSLLQIMVLRHLQNAGHKPVILIGGGTTKVGDPTGKDESRQLLSEQQIQENIDSLTKVFMKFIKFGDGPSDAILVNNADWLDEIKYLEFLRNYGRHFTINRMLSFESVKQRLAREQPLTFLEFNYMLLQSYDFLELYRRYGTKLQLGGSDQWGNIVGGVELTRKIEQKQVFGLTAPLLTTSDGKKMGKTAAGAVWLNGDLLSEFEYWQFWRNTADADVLRFLKLFTELPIKQLREYETYEGSALNDLKVILADETTRMLHGNECLPQIHERAATLFGKAKGDGPGDLSALSQVMVTGVEVSQTAGVSVVDLLVKAEMAASRSEAKRLIKLGGMKLYYYLRSARGEMAMSIAFAVGARVNDVKVEDEGKVLFRDSFDEQGRLKLSSGKKKHVAIVLG